MEQLSEEVNDFSMIDDREIPSAGREEASGDNSKMKPDVVWHYASTMTRPDGQIRFPRLSKIALLVLTIPHSNAEEERVFSMIKQNKTAFRPSLNQEETLGSIMTIKMEMANQSVPRGGVFQFPTNVLNEAKKATRKYNRAHSN